jgi:hypothetical protein
VTNYLEHGKGSPVTPAPLTRRALLKAGGTAGAALMLPGTAFARVRRHHRRRRMSSHLRRSSYHSIIGQRFGVRGSAVKLKLISVQDLNTLQTRSENAFALVFRSPRAVPAFTQQISELYHPTIGWFQFLLTPGEASAQGHHYVAIINRLHA